MEIQIAEDGSTPPTIGRFVKGLKKRILETEPKLAESDLTSAVLSAIKIMGSAGNLERGVEKRRTGLVLGKVQSGKTISASSVIAVARDNGVRVVIYIAGTTNILEGQAFSRLKKYFSGTPSPYEDWLVMSSKSSDLDAQESRSSIDGVIRTWGSERNARGLLINVQKNSANLDKLRGLLERCNLANEPVLFIDDEADQASLNTKARSASRVVSATFSSIHRLRNVFKTHLYLQYTATPQALLLISIDNLLSPDFAHVLEPGPQYIGGLEIFGNPATGVPASAALEAIPESEDADSDDGAPPESFKDSFYYFFLLCADRSLRRDSSKISMLVHPHSLVAMHEAYQRYWMSLLRFQESMYGTPRLRTIYFDCFTRHRRSFPSDWDDDEAFFSALFSELANVTPKVTVVNSSSGSEIDWDTHLFHVLIGGQSLNRGFTVKDLVVTYMPRGRSGSSFTADTVQQRARFFGYNAGVLSQIKIWMHDSLRQAFEDYVIHEESVRTELKEREGQPLSEWRRHFFLDRGQNPTRRNVLSDDPNRHRINRIVRQSYLLDETEITSGNQRIIEKFLEKNSFEDFQGHRKYTLPLEDLVGEFLQQYKTARSDTGNFITASLILKRHLESNPGLNCHVIVWGFPIERSVKRGGSITLDGGPQRRRNSSVLADRSLVTLQIFSVNLIPGAGTEAHPGPYSALQLVLPTSVSLSDGISVDFI